MKFTFTQALWTVLMLFIGSLIKISDKEYCKDNIIYNSDNHNAVIDLPEEWPRISKDDLNPDTLIASLRNDTLFVGFPSREMIQPIEDASELGISQINMD